MVRKVDDKEVVVIDRIVEEGFIVVVGNDFTFDFIDIEDVVNVVSEENVFILIILKEIVYFSKEEVKNNDFVIDLI